MGRINRIDRVESTSNRFCVQDSGSVAHSETVEYEEIEDDFSAMDLQSSDAHSVRDYR